MPVFMKYVGEVWRCANLYRTENYAELGIGSYQDYYILNICKNPGVSQEKLSKLIYVHKSNVARQLNSLEEKGFVTRVPDPRDKRSLLVYPTEKAQNALPFIREVHRRWNESVLAGFSEEERSAVASLMEKLSSNARRVAEDLGGDER